MPHYFFDLTDDKIVHDFKGKQLRDLKQAREHALIIARDVMTTKSTLLREPISEWSVTVKDGKFQKLFSVPIMGAMSQSDENTEPSGHPPTDPHHRHFAKASVAERRIALPPVLEEQCYGSILLPHHGRFRDSG